MPQILVIDDEPNVCYSFKKGLESPQLRVLIAETARAGIDLVRSKSPDVIILDVRLPDMSGLDAYNEIRAINPALPVIIVTAFTTTETAIEAIKRGAFDYLLKPVDFKRLQEVIAKALTLSQANQLSLETNEESREQPSEEMIVGRSQAMQEVYKAIGRIAPQDVPVLIQGESGTGKELVARAISTFSRRASGPFVALNCAAIPESILESELFGHERGAFTGADSQRIGKFEQASGGSIFLDEVGDMSILSQAKILRLLQEHKFERVGGNSTIETDVRIIAATNRNLRALVDAGMFRLDLFYRLEVFTIRLPALRDRLDDLPLLVRHFMQSGNRQLEKRVRGVSADAYRLLEAYHWPGNVRELQSAITFAILHATNDIITPECLPEKLRTSEAHPPETPIATGTLDRHVAELLAGVDDDIYEHVHAAVDRILLPMVIEHVHGSQSEASTRLGMTRTTLRSRLRSLGLTAEKRLISEPDRDER